LNAEWRDHEELTRRSQLVERESCAPEMNDLVGY